MTQLFSIYDSWMIYIYFSAIAVIAGAVMGSFLNCAAYRIAHGESFVKGRSHCTSCGHELGALDLIPVISWMLQKGKCRYCGTKISVRYPMTELFFAMMSLLCLWKFDLTWKCILYWLFGWILFTLSLIDLETMIIPDLCHVLAVILWVITILVAGYDLKTIGTHLMAAVLYGGGVLVISLVMDRVLGRESMGGGDIKLFAVMGLYLGVVASILSLFLACVIGLIFAVLAKRVREASGGAFPFGPSIALATWLVLLYGGPFVNWYLGML